MPRLVALIVFMGCFYAAAGHAAPVSWRPPTLTVTNPSSGVVDLAWQNVPGTDVTVFTFDSGVCRFGCETLHVDDGFAEITNSNWVGYTMGFQVCSTEVQSQVCTSRVWITVQ